MIRQSQLVAWLICYSSILLVVGNIEASTVTLDVTDDASVVSNNNSVSYANNNYGSETAGYVGRAFDVRQPGNIQTTEYFGRFYLKFDLGSLANTSVVSATLGVRYSNPWDSNTSNENFQLETAASDSWDESTLTWNNQPGLGSVITNFNRPTTFPNLLTFDVTSVVQQELAGDTFVSFVVKGINETQSPKADAWYYFNTKETSEVGSVAPYLTVVTVPVPEPNSLLLGALGATGLFLLRLVWH